MIRIIIAGGRDFDDYVYLDKCCRKVCLEMKSDSIEIISGKALGADRLGEKFANAHNLNLVEFPAEWHKYGVAAGPIRNCEMAKYAKETKAILCAFWDGSSSGTKHMITTAMKNKFDEIHIFNYVKMNRANS